MILKSNLGVLGFWVFRVPGRRFWFSGVRSGVCSGCSFVSGVAVFAVRLCFGAVSVSLFCVRFRLFCFFLFAFLRRLEFFAFLRRLELQVEPLQVCWCCYLLRLKPPKASFGPNFWCATATVAFFGWFKSPVNGSHPRMIFANLWN